MNSLAAVMRVLCTFGAALATASCSTPGGTVAVVAVGNVAKNNAAATGSGLKTIAIPLHSASTGSSGFSAIPVARVRVLPFDDNRNDIDTEGRLTAAFGVPMNRIRFEPGPATLLGQVIVSEISAAGHTVTDSDALAQISGAVLAFDVHTDTTLLYWDVIGHLAVSLQFLITGGASSGAPIAYRTQCTDRTFVWPTEAVVAKVMRQCIDDFANKLRSDGRAATALRNALSTP